MIKDSRTYLFTHKVFRLIVCTLLLSSLFLVAGNAASHTHTKNGISVIVPNGSSQYMGVVQSVREGLKKNNSGETLKVINLSGFTSTKIPNLDTQKLVILVGSKSFDHYVKANAKSPYLTTLITQSAFNYIFAKANNKGQFVGGVSIDQPSRRFIALAKAVIPNLKTTALVYGPELIKNKQTVLKGLDKYNLKYNLVEVLLNDNPVKKLRKAYELNDALILFPDRKKFNSSLSRWVLTLSYQYKIPVISYSKKYAKAGALASLFSTSKQIGDQTAEMMMSFFKNPRSKIKKLVEPKYFDIHINKSVESALNLRIPSKLELLKKISN